MVKLIGYMLLASSVAGLAHQAGEATRQYLASQKALTTQLASPEAAAPRGSGAVVSSFAAE